MITLQYVLKANKRILEKEPGLKGQADIAKLEGALARIDNWKHLDDLMVDVASSQLDFLALSQHLQSLVS